jgi:plastocyanin
VIGGRVAVAAGAQVAIDNFTFAPTPLPVKAGTIVTWVNHNDIPHSIVCPALKVHSHA